MIDLHTHTVFSDGALIPAELVRRAQAKGLTVIGLTDHGDASNLDLIIPRMVTVAEALNRVLDIQVVPGIELTHVPPPLIAESVRAARALGARIVLVHGETIVEPVAPGTNRAAIDAGVDILAHPGLITESDATAAARRGVFLEISARKGHSLTNGHVARIAGRTGVRLVIDTDTHEPGDLIDAETARRIVRGAGLTDSDFETMQENAARLC